MGLDRKHRIEILDGTLSALRQGFYEKNGKQIKLSISAEQMEECRVILPEEASIYAKSECDTLCFGVGTRATFECIDTDSVSVALNLSHKSAYSLSDNAKKEPLILNFADSFMPGGLVRSGARAQEEDLCRQSSLLLSLESKAAGEFYSHNRKNKSPLGTDAFILTPHVEIIRDRQGNFFEEPFVAAVLTCAAPDIRNGLHGMDKGEYRHLLRHRIEGMLKFASHEGYTRIVLGAWGCGVFANPPALISDVFYEIFRNGNFKELFDTVIFAVLDSSKDKKTFNEFYRNFGGENFWRDDDMEEIDQIHAEMRKREKYLDKIQGCLIGGAAGDALGYAVEFMSAEN
ncbi:MAG: TIGR02452 family protein, partial [Elusimicrobiales bacterium]|nr:TIGR02452 family protein [Elusimicrobiales bacterium]